MRKEDKIRQQAQTEPDKNDQNRPQPQPREQMTAKADEPSRTQAHKVLPLPD